MIKQRLAYLALASCGLAFVFGYGVGFWHDQLQVPDAADAVTFTSSKQPEGVDISDVWKIWYILESRHVGAKKPTTQERVWGMMEGLAKTYDDPYTQFFPPEETKAFEQEISGTFEGVGMEVDKVDETIVVVTPLKNSPAMKAGMMAGDKILAINGTSTQGMSLDSAIKLIRGKRGTNVTLNVLREGVARSFDVTITRDVINMQIVETELLPAYSYTADGRLIATNKPADSVFVIKLNSFTAQSPALFRDALKEFGASGSYRLLVDLRNNPGGYLDAAISIAGYFLDPGSIAVIEDFGTKKEREVHRTRQMEYKMNEKVKLAVLVNGGSASASEILAGALSDHGKAKLIGSKTYGKGSVQELIHITAATSLKVTIAQWLTPNGKTISKVGITPDIEVKAPSATSSRALDPQKDTAIEYLRGKANLK